MTDMNSPAYDQAAVGYRWSRAAAGELAMMYCWLFGQVTSGTGTEPEAGTVTDWYWKPDRPRLGNLHFSPEGRDESRDG